MRAATCLLFALLGSAHGYKSYEGYQVFETRILVEEDADVVALLLKNHEYDFWVTPRVGRSAQIMVSNASASELENSLSRWGLQPSLLVENVERTLQRERGEIEDLRAKEKRDGRAPTLDRYLDFYEIMAYIDEVVTTYANIASVIEIGRSYEGRPIRVVKLSNGPGKSAIFFDSVLHAREWIGPPTLLFAINELTENLANNQALLDANDWYFLLVANPDGFIYSWTDDRLWRKSRSPNANTVCFGTDLNRNFDQHWAEEGTLDECVFEYPGTGPFSEVEAKAVADFLQATTSITFYVAVHSYGMYILYPWSHTADLPPNADELDSIGQEANVAIIGVNNNSYTVGTFHDALYVAFGTSQDWAYEQAGIPLSYTIELPGGGPAGFDPPASLIAPTNAESWEAYKVFASYIPQARRKFV